MSDIVKKENYQQFDDLATALNFIRQAMDALLDNKPVMAWNSLIKAREYTIKTRESFIEKDV